MKKIFFYFCFLLFLTSCKKSEPYLNNAIIIEKLNIFYKYYSHSNSNLYSKPLPKDLFSPDLKVLLAKVIEASKVNREKVKNSSSILKPLLLEGSIFSSLYEGYTAYKITSIDIIQSVNSTDMAAKATIEFEYSDTDAHMVWRDQVYLVNSSNTGWKIDNIIFDRTLSGGEIKDLKMKLNDFLLKVKIIV